jgi:hypothetical protein
MNRFGLSRWVVLLAVILLLAQQARVQPKLDVSSAAAKGAVILYTVPPHTVCVGDTFMVEGGGFILPQVPAGKPVIHLAISTALGTATPDEFVQVGNEVYFRFAYTASRGGDETIKAVENDALAIDALRFKVDKSCAFGASLTSIVQPRRPM